MDHNSILQNHLSHMTLLAELKNAYSSIWINNVM